MCRKVWPDPNYSELEYQAWLEDFLASVAVDTGNHSGFVWSEAGIATMAYLGSTMGSNMSVYYDPTPGDEFNATHLAIWNSATVAFGGGNDSFEDLLPGGDSAMAMYIGPGGIVVDKPTGYMWTEAGIATMTYLWNLNGANMSMYGDPEPGDVFTEAHLGIWNGPRWPSAVETTPWKICFQVVERRWRSTLEQTASSTPHRPASCGPRKGCKPWPICGP